MDRGLTFDEASHAYYLDGERIRNVTGILQDAGIVNFGGVDPVILESARLFGKAAHKATELYDLDNLDEAVLDPMLRPILAGWKRFRADFNVEFSPDQIECRTVSRILRVAGTLDRWFLFNGELVILDIKTGGMYKSTGVQLAGYKVLWEEMTGMRVARRWGLRLTMDGKYKLTKFESPNDEAEFLSAAREIKEENNGIEYATA